MDIDNENEILILKIKCKVCGREDILDPNSPYGHNYEHSKAGKKMLDEHHKIGMLTYRELLIKHKDCKGKPKDKFVPSRYVKIPYDPSDTS